MRNAKCTICGHVRAGDKTFENCPACGARAVFAVATSEPVSRLEQHEEPEHGSLFFPGAESCLNSD
jgi:predicted  nucleic acid-binding Zn-ribbon protein